MSRSLFVGGSSVLALVLLLVNIAVVDGVYRPARTLPAAQDTTTCEPVSIPMCRNVGWNFTMMPNQFNHDSQEEAGLEAHQFWPLVKVDCSPDLTVFLCSMYAPICMEEFQKQLPPCRSLCERARRGCAPTMAQYGFNWPDRMDCTHLPDFGDENNLCVDPRNGSMAMPTPRFAAVTPPASPVDEATDDATLPPPKTREKCPCTCPAANLITSNPDARYGGVGGCAPACRSPLASPQEMQLGQYWITSWAILCCLCTAFTLMTYVIDTTRFKYPERPIVFIALCYLMVSVGFLIRVIGGHDAVGCDGAVSLQKTVSNGLCTAVFLLLYFFGMASCIWWVILSFNWYLAAGLRWSTEAISSHSTKFHFFAWFVPCVQSIAILVTKAVDGDPIAGVCYVGNHSTDHLKGFVVAPLIVYLVIGVGFLLAGFISMKRIRRAIKQQTADREKRETLKRLMRRIAIFSLCTFLPNAALVGCYVYEIYNRDAWEESVTCSSCSRKMPANRPFFAVFMLKYLCMLVVGITSGVWLIGRKTVESWKYFLCSRCVQPGSTKSSEFTLIKAPDSVIRSQRSPYPMSHV